MTVEPLTDGELHRLSQVIAAMTRLATMMEADERLSHLEQVQRALAELKARREGRN